ncbi:hypothetical protein ACX92S_13895 (plasmid) [Enterococcus faecalis]
MTEFEYVAIKYRNNKMTRKIKKFESNEKLVDFLKTPQGRKYRGEVREKTNVYFVRKKSHSCFRMLFAILCICQLQWYCK